MAKNEKTIRQAYPATVIVDGESIAPGTAVTLPESEANSIAATFGVIPATAEHKRSSGKPQGPDLGVLDKAVADARATYDAAESALKAENSGDKEAKAFEAAEKALDRAEAALAEAKGQ